MDAWNRLKCKYLYFCTLHLAFMLLLGAMEKSVVFYACKRILNCTYVIYISVNSSPVKHTGSFFSFKESLNLTSVGHI